MKTINVTFEDKEYEILIEIKKSLSWRDFIKIAAGCYSEMAKPVG